MMLDAGHTETPTFAVWARHKSRLVSLAEMVAKTYGITVDDLKSKRRDREVSYPRQELMLAAKGLGYSLAEIGTFLGGRDHTTVLHGIRAAKKREAQQ